MRRVTTAIGRLAPLAPLVLRLAVGIVMVAHGWQKLTGGPADFGQGLLGGLGLPAPVLLGWVVTLVELLGGILLLVGFLTRLAALAFACVMVGAISLVKVNVGLIAPQGAGAGAELDLALLAGAVALVVLGPGSLSVDRAMKLETGQLNPGRGGAAPAS